mmetsp:Transcript_70767/g.188758  ORF Transcript_70767/g.188758 Transcript_70767/m.188758 type:complete len:854 (-) Transcript_70767:65-2626(-)
MEVDCGLGSAPDTALPDLMACIDRHMTGRTFLVGERVTLADISVALSLREAAAQLGAKGSTTYKAAMRWMLTCLHNPHFVAIVGPPLASSPLVQASTPAAAVKSAGGDDVTAQANLVRELKAAKAPKSEIDAAVKVLLELKAKAGVDPKSGAGASAAPAPPAAAGSDADAVAAQANKVRELKAAKAPKPEIDAAVKVLLELKARAGVDPKTNAPASANSGSTTAGAAAPSGSVSAEAVAAQATKVRELKNAKAPKAEIDAAVKMLLTLKAQAGIDPAAGKQEPPPQKKKVAAEIEPAATPEDPEKAARKAEKKASKEAEKAKKEAEKKQRAEALQQAKSAAVDGPSVTLRNFLEHEFGNLVIKSETRTDRQWTRVRDLGSLDEGTTVWIRSRLADSRKVSSTLNFVTLRQTLDSVQAVVAGKPMATFVGGVAKESVVDVEAKIARPAAPVTSTTQQNVELAVSRFYVVSRAVPILPFQLEDANRPEQDFEKDESLVRVNQNVRLDNRIIDLRTVANQGIFRIQSGVCALFREFLTKNGFTEIHTPKMIATASEGGADVFKLTYFEGHAFLAQSPQLYKQMALAADLGRVFEIGPVFRSENSMTHRHMTEFTGLDMEMCFRESYTEVLDVLEGLFIFIFNGLNERFQPEIEAVRRQYPFADLKYRKEGSLRLKYWEAVKLLREKGPDFLKADIAKATDEYWKNIYSEHLKSVEAHEDDQDIGTEDEKLLGRIILQEYDTQFYIIDKFPTALRPFYTMPDAANPKWSNSYDIFIRGEEVTSGAQRIHDAKLLQSHAQELGVDLKPIQAYVDAFTYGAFPHAGGGIGMERVAMLFLQLNNIRKTSMFPRDPKRLTP